MPDALTIAMDNVERGVDHVITRNGEPVAVLISAERYDELVAKLSELSTPDGAACESCSQPATVTLADGSHWCRECDGSARRLGYDDDTGSSPVPEETGP